MSGSSQSNLATMIVISLLLSHHPCVAATTMRSMSEHDGDASVRITADQEATMLLRRASVVFAVTLSISMCLQLSPLELIYNNNGEQGNPMARDPLQPLSTTCNRSGRQSRNNDIRKSAPITRRSTKVVRRKRLEPQGSQVAFNTRSIKETSTSVSGMSDSCDSNTEYSNSEGEEGVRTLATLLANVDCTDVKNSWTRRGQMPRQLVSKNILHTMLNSMDSHNSLQSIPEYANIPEMTTCDTFLSLSSGFSSFNASGSRPSISSVTPKKIKCNNTYTQGNAEWKDFEQKVKNYRSSLYSL